MIHKITQNTWNFWTVNLIMRAKKLLSSRQIFRYAVPARTVTKKARSQNRVRVVYFKSTTAPDFNHSVSSEQHHQTCKLRAWLGCINEDARAVSKSVSCCLNSLRQIRSIQRSVSRQVRLSVVTSLVWTTKVPPSLLRLVDFSVSAQCSRTAGAAVRTMTTSLTIYTGREWLSVLNAAARLVCHSQNYDHISQNLHWLWVAVSAQCSRTAGVAVRTMTTSLTIYTGCEWLSVLNAATGLVWQSELWPHLSQCTLAVSGCQNYDHISHNVHWLWVAVSAQCSRTAGVSQSELWPHPSQSTLAVSARLNQVSPGRPCLLVSQ